MWNAECGIEGLVRSAISSTRVRRPFDRFRIPHSAFSPRRCSMLRNRLLWLTAALAALACDDTTLAPDARLAPIQASSFANSEWSAPVNLGAAINTAAIEANPTLSPDELSLYFQSDRPNGLGGTDIWVSHRACPDC